LTDGIKAASGEADAGPAAKRVAGEADASLVDERGPFGMLENLIESERDVT
jgi:hypothetical protein